MATLLFNTLCLPFMPLPIPYTTFKIYTGPDASPQFMGWSQRLFCYLLSLPDPLALFPLYVCDLSSVLLGCPSLLCVQTCQSYRQSLVITPVGVSKQQGRQSPAAGRRNVSLAVGCWKPHVGRKRAKAELRAGWHWSLNFKTVPTLIQHPATVCCGTNSTFMSPWAYRLTFAPVTHLLSGCLNTAP